jgi:hypothetical protein
MTQRHFAGRVGCGRSARLSRTCLVGYGESDARQHRHAFLKIIRLQSSYEFMTGLPLKTCGMASDGHRGDSSQKSIPRVRILGHLSLYDDAESVPWFLSRAASCNWHIGGSLL